MCTIQLQYDDYIDIEDINMMYRIKGILFSILSLSRSLSGKPDRLKPDDDPDKDSIENK